MNPFRLMILGSNAAVPANGRFTSHQVLQIHQALFMIDCGEGAQLRLSQYKVKRNKIKAIFISHLHGDHVFGLPGLLTSLSHFGRQLPLNVYGPPGIKELIDANLRLSQSHLSYALEIIEIQADHVGQVYESKACKVFSFPLKHRIPTIGYRFIEQVPPPNINKAAIAEYKLTVEQIIAAKSGQDVEVNGQSVKNDLLVHPRKSARSYAYCSDTVYDPSLVEKILGVDLLYHETTYLEDLAHLAKERMHSTAKQAAQIAKAAQVGQLVTGHYSSRYKYVDTILAEAKSIFENTVIGYDGAIIDVPATDSTQL